MNDYNIAKIEKNAIVEFLSKVELFKTLDRSALEDFTNSLSPIFVEGGTTLIQQGAQDTTMYILYQGRLRVLARREDTTKEKELILAEISPGQFVGEIALLTHLPRTTTVRTVRDSILLRVEENAFKEFEKKHTQEVIEIAKTAIKRLATKTRPTQVGENFVTITVCPAGNSNHRPFVQRLAKELNKIKPTFLLDKETCIQHFGKDIFLEDINDEDKINLTAWLQDLENQYGYIIYDTDGGLNHWSKLCVRHADRILFLAEDGKSPALNPVEHYLKTETKKSLPFTEIVFMHQDEQAPIRGTEEWLDQRIFFGYYHLAIDSQPHYDKLIRFLTGQAFGVIMNGGGARGMAHIGVLQALAEMNIPVDMIGGTSMGAIVAGLYASKYTTMKMKNITEDMKRKFRKELTLPVIALLKGKFYTEFCEAIFDAMRIEDLWIRFFCVSTNLTEAKMKIHDQGLMWLAVRASSAVPAIYPPIYDDEGNMLVDGGITNNMPVEVMRKMICGGKILAINCHLKHPELFKKKFPHRWISGWKLFFQKFNPFYGKKDEYDNIISIILASMDLSISFKQQQMAEMADYYLEIDTHEYSNTEFTKGEIFIDLGYRTAVEHLPKILGLQEKKKAKE